MSFIEQVSNTSPTVGTGKKEEKILKKEKERKKGITSWDVYIV